MKLGSIPDSSSHMSFRSKYQKLLYLRVHDSTEIWLFLQIFVLSWTLAWNKFWHFGWGVCLEPNKLLPTAIKNTMTTQSLTYLYSTSSEALSTLIWSQKYVLDIDWVNDIVTKCICEVKKASYCLPSKYQFP